MLDRKIFDKNLKKYVESYDIEINEKKFNAWYETVKSMHPEIFELCVDRLLVNETTITRMTSFAALVYFYYDDEYIQETLQSIETQENIWVHEDVKNKICNPDRCLSMTKEEYDNFYNHIMDINLDL